MTIKRPSHQEIAARAYELYVQRGRIDGYATDDWLQAEYDLMQLPVHKLAELEPPVAPDHPPRRTLVAVVRSAFPK